MEKELVDVTKKSGIVFGGRVIGLIFGFIFSFIAARYMGADVYGKFMYVYTLISFFPIIIKLGLDQGLVSFIPKLTVENKFKQRNSLISFSVFLTFILSIICSIIIMYKSDIIASKVLNNNELSNLVRLVAPLIIFLVVISMFKGLFRGIDDIKSFVKSKDILIPIVKLISLFILSLYGYGIYGLYGSFFTSLTLGVIYLINRVRKHDLFGKLTWKHFNLYKDILKFSLPLLMAGFVGFFINKTDTFMIGYFLSEEKVGIYNIALRIGMLSRFVLVAFITMFTPMISFLYHNGEIEKLAKIYKAITKWILVSNIIALSLILLFSKSVMNIFGQEFVLGSTALILISIGQAVNAAVGPADKINAMTGNPQYSFYTNLITVIINVILNYNLIPVFGIEGAAIASLISVAVANIIRLGLVYNTHKIHPYNKEYFKVIFSNLISYIIIHNLNSFININWLMQMIILSTFYIIVFMVIYLSLGTADEDRIIFNALLKKLKRWDGKKYG